MTEINTPTPTDAENFLAQIDELVAHAREDDRLCYDQTPSQRYADARERVVSAVLAKWGAPPVVMPVGMGPVAEVLSSRRGNDTSTIDKALPDGTKIYTETQVQALIARGAARERMSPKQLLILSDEYADHPKEGPAFSGNPPRHL